MVSRYFGLPGCGKTTTLAALAYNGLKSGKYAHVYGNVHMSVPGYTYVPFAVLGKYQLENCLILIDEAMVECGDRDYKGFGKEKIEFFVMHRHYSTDIVLFSQEADGIDKKVRSVSADMYYCKKGLLLGRWLTTIYKIPYGIVWPKENDNGENLGKIVMGYMKPSLLSRLFARRLYRPRYYRWFDSWEARPLPALPDKVEIAKGQFVAIETNPGSVSERYWFRNFWRCGSRFRSLRKQMKRRNKRAEKAARRQKEKDMEAAALARLTAHAGVYEVRKGDLRRGKA